jgi:hypothetical protein
MPPSAVVRERIVCVRRKAMEGDGRDGPRPGVHNQKQEPHTKMWEKRDDTYLYSDLKTSCSISQYKEHQIPAISDSA